MRRINWDKLLRIYPGEEKIETALLEGRTFTAVARELGIPVATLKSYYYRKQSGFGGLRSHVVTADQKYNYAEHMDAAIRAFARMEGMQEAEYREWIRTEDGEAHFLWCCKQIKLPVFRCRYLRRSR